jgi:hypothetical protein
MVVHEKLECVQDPDARDTLGDGAGDVRGDRAAERCVVRATFEIGNELLRARVMRAQSRVIVTDYRPLDDLPSKHVRLERGGHGRLYADTGTAARYTSAVMRGPELSGVATCRAYRAGVRSKNDLKRRVK